MLTTDAKQKLRRAGEISRDLKRKLRLLAKPGCSFLKLASTAELFIDEHENTVRPAFPLNISLNDIAAHYSPSINDKSVLPKKGVVKLDLGIHVDGYISDSAITIDLNSEEPKLVNAAKDALNKATEKVADGVSINTISHAIESTINEAGYQPIYNLTGHKISRFNLHAGVNIPNTTRKVGFLSGLKKLREDDVYAIEPFATSGVGIVVNEKQEYIFRLQENTANDPFLAFLKDLFHMLPFSPRWIPKLSDTGQKEMLRQFHQAVKSQKIMGYPVLVEKSHAWVSQFEHTVRVTKNGCKILT